MAGRPDSLIVYCQARGNNYEWYSVVRARAGAGAVTIVMKIKYMRGKVASWSVRGMRDQAASGGRSEVIENTFRFILESD